MSRVDGDASPPARPERGELKVEILERELRELGRVRTPRGFVGRVLSAAGVGERYAELETVIGTFFVSWNRAGVTARLDGNRAGRGAAGARLPRPANGRRF